MVLVLITIILPLIFLIVDLWKERKIYSPSVLFNTIFFVTLLLYSFKWSYIQQDLSNTTLWCLLLCEIGFNIPIVISYFAKSRDKSLNNSDEMKKIINKNLDKSSEKLEFFRLNSKLEFGIFIFVLVLFFAEIIICKGFPLLWKIIGSDKTYFDFSVPKITSWFHGLIIIMGVYSLAKPNCIYKLFYFAIGFLIISRQMIIAMVLESAIIYLITQKNKPKNFYLYCVLVVMIVLLGFSVMGNMRTGESSFLWVAEFKRFAEYVPTVIKWVYSYMCFSISNLNNLITIAPPGITKGFSTWNEIMPSMFDFDSSYILFNEDYLVSQNFNVSTFAPSLYLDFGIFGVGIFCLIIGMISQFVFKNIEKNEVYTMLYSIIAYSIIFIFFTNMFFNFQVICQVVFIILIFVVLNGFIEKKSKNNNKTQGGKV